MHSNHRNTYTHYLRLLIKLVSKLDEQAGDDSSFLHARLTPDMFPLNVQARAAAFFALRTCAAGKNDDFPNAGSRINSPDGLNAYLSEVIEFIDRVTEPFPEQMDDKAGFKAVSLPTDDYVHLFSLPNFFFHLSMVYAIAKQQGFRVTKGDFDGIHEYPEDFSWEKG